MISALLLGSLALEWLRLLVNKLPSKTDVAKGFFICKYLTFNQLQHIF